MVKDNYRDKLNRLNVRKRNYMEKLKWECPLGPASPKYNQLLDKIEKIDEQIKKLKYKK